MESPDLQRIRYGLLYLLFLLAPFHAFLITWLRSFELQNSWLFLGAASREILLMSLGLLTIPPLIRAMRSGRLKRLIIENIWAVAFIGLGLLFIAFQDNLNQWIWGARFTLLPLGALLLFQLIPLKKDQMIKLLHMILATAGIVTLLGLIHALLLPQDFLVNFGYSINRDIWDTGAAISSCQFLEHTQQFCRATSTFGGPTRYGTYLLLMLSLATAAFFSLRSDGQKRLRLTVGVIGLLIFANIVLTFSRSIWLALFGMLFAGALLIPRRPGGLKKMATVFFALIGIFLLFFIFNYESIQVILLRASSTSERLLYMQEGLRVFFENPLGLGLGTAGAASLHFERLITENWYLQIGIEMGWLGLVLFSGALLQLSIRLFRKRYSPLVFGILIALIGVSLVGLVTHSFEETTTVILMFGLAGLALRHTPEEDSVAVKY